MSTPQYAMQRTMPFSQGRTIKMAPVRGKGFQMPAVRGGSAKPTPQQQAVIDVHVSNVPPREDTSYMYTSYVSSEVQKIAEQGQAGLLPAHLQSVFDEAILNDSTPTTAAMKVQSFQQISRPAATPELDMLAPVEAPVEAPKKGISPITYAVGAAVLLLGGLYFLKN